ncbi:hypothetical protein OG21DRAFT_1316281 [Imleria badia]|nr:hypothetical protein OG21DRAFT_1316281 [Imleria badia]
MQPTECYSGYLPFRSRSDDKINSLYHAMQRSGTEVEVDRHRHHPLRDPPGHSFRQSQVDPPLNECPADGQQLIKYFYSIRYSELVALDSVAAVQIQGVSLVLGKETRLHDSERNIKNLGDIRNNRSSSRSRLAMHYTKITDDILPIEEAAHGRLIKNILQSGLYPFLCSQLNNLSSDDDLSTRGVVQCVDLPFSRGRNDVVLDGELEKNIGSQSHDSPVASYSPH